MDVLRDFTADMRLRGLSSETINKRLQLIARLALHLDPLPLLDATSDDLRAFQRRFQHLSPASMDIYARHVQAFYRWAHGRELIPADPAAKLPRPRVPKGLPHPTSFTDLRTIFACTVGALRVAYVLAAFAGLRRGEICRLQRADLDLANPVATALVNGKGGKQRVVPILGPVIEELLDYGLPRTGWVITRKGHAYEPERLSADSHWHLERLGLDTTLHSMRHAFATTAYRTSHDLLLVKELLGHASVATTEIYAAPDMTSAHARLSGLSDVAADLLGGRAPLRIVRG